MGVAELPLRGDFPVALLLLLVAAAVGAVLLFFGVLVLAASERGGRAKEAPGASGPNRPGRTIPRSRLFAFVPVQRSSRHAPVPLSAR
jgi:hypothetical protein